MRTGTIDNYLAIKFVVERIARKVQCPIFQETSASSFHINLEMQQSNDWKTCPEPGFTFTG